MVAEKLRGVLGRDALLNRSGFHEMVQPVHELEREVGFRISLITLPKERLAMQIADLDHVVVDDRQRTDARARKRR